MKTGPDALGIVENEFGSAKYVNATQRSRYRPKRVRERKKLKRDLKPSVPYKRSPVAQNMKTGLDALCTVENESGCAKYKKGTSLRYRPK
jgi:hypothetical protein